MYKNIPKMPSRVLYSLRNQTLFFQLIVKACGASRSVVDAAASIPLFLCCVAAITTRIMDHLKIYVLYACVRKSFEWKNGFFFVAITSEFWCAALRKQLSGRIRSHAWYIWIIKRRMCVCVCGVVLCECCTCLSLRIFVI